MPLTHDDISKICRLFDEGDFVELKVELDGTKLEIRRGDAGVPVAAPTAMTHTPAPELAAAAAPEPATAPAAPTTEGEQVTAPMVGTFYRRPAPDEDAFVEIGQKVEAGDPLCLIEVMKLYTTINTEIAGTVAEILPENGAMVEHGQVLFVIEPE